MATDEQTNVDDSAATHCTLRALDSFMSREMRCSREQAAEAKRLKDFRAEDRHMTFFECNAKSQGLFAQNRTAKPFVFVRRVAQ